MAIYYLLKLALTFHIIGLAIAAGLSLANFLTFQKFRKVYFNNKNEALIILDGNAKLPQIANIGIAISIISGVAMMILTDGVFIKQLWFEIKLGLLIIIILNIVWRSHLKKELHKMIAGNETGTYGSSFPELSRMIHISAFVQILLFLLIFILAMFRFN